VPSGISEVVDGSCGVFVSASSGTDASGEGTKEKPFASLKKALTKGATIYACADTKPFDEALAVNDVVTLFGGLDCKSWAYKAGTKTSWSAPAGDVVATVKLDASLHVDDFKIEAKDAPALMPDEHAAGRSSIAIVAEAKSALELNRCDVIAGNGGDGAAGEAPMDAGTPGKEGGSGNGGCDEDVFEVFGLGGQMMCDGTDVSGGQGGTGNANMSGGAGSPGAPVGDMGKGGVGQMGPSVCENGADGATGTSGTAGNGAAADGLGSLTAAGFVGVSGDDGAPGMPGQGGGGGGGAKLCANGKAGPSGGGGGSGGCAGVGGKGGYGGGASIGIASIGAKLSFAETKITTKNGGKGGAGSEGQPGGAGGIGGMPGAADAQAKACAGGKGGNGGRAARVAAGAAVIRSGSRTRGRRRRWGARQSQ
jgi:hypothetical protein